MLNQKQKEFYRENGYLLVKGLLPASEAKKYRDECHALAERLAKHKDMDATWESARESLALKEKTVILHCHNVQFYAAAFSKLIVDEAFVDAAADLIESPNVQLHHTKMFI